MDILNLPKTRYAIQKKEKSYLIWKFKHKLKEIVEVYIKQNIITTEIKFTNRKKKSKKLIILEKLFNIEKENLFVLIQLQKFMHNNDRYLDSIHHKKF
jgi:hypothetical protein